MKVMILMWRLPLNQL